MAERALTENYADGKIGIKKLFYVLRPLYACRWIEQLDAAADGICQSRGRALGRRRGAGIGGRTLHVKAQPVEAGLSNSSQRMRRRCARRSRILKRRKRVPCP